METLLAQIVAGALGGNAAGAASNQLNMGKVLNTVVGLIGGLGAVALLRACWAQMARR